MPGDKPALHDGDRPTPLAPDLPEESLFSLDEYLEMYKAGATKRGYRILLALDEHDELCASELAELLGKEDNDLHYYLRRLKNTGLIRNRRDPNTGTEETYSYYTLSALGEIVLTDGLKGGIERLASQEDDIKDHYS